MNKETEAHNVPLPVEHKKLLDMEKYKNLLQMASDPPHQALKAQRPSMHMPIQYEGVKLMTRVMDVNCPHCGESVGRWSFYSRVAASEGEETEACEITTTPYDSINEQIAAKYQELYDLIKVRGEDENSSRSQDGSWKWGDNKEKGDEKSDSDKAEEPKEDNDPKLDKPEPVEAIPVEVPAPEPTPAPEPKSEPVVDEAGLSPEEIYIKREMEASAKILELNEKIKNMLK
jgi:hypothetical protein